MPYFIEMKEKKLIDTFAYIAFASTESTDVSKWLKAHQEEVEKFYNWSESFQWKTK